MATGPKDAGKTQAQENSKIVPHRSNAVHSGLSGLKARD